MPHSSYHVLLVSPSFGTFGGCEAFMFRLASELNRQQIPVSICFKRVSGEFSLDETLETAIDESPVPVTFVDRASKGLWDQITNADLIHGQHTSIDIALMAKLARKPLVLTVHCWMRNRWSPRALVGRAANWLADRRWYNSDFVWNKWEPASKSRTSGKLPIASHLPEGVVRPEKRKGFVFAARWIENKGLEVLLHAYARAEISREDWPLTLLGDGPLRPRVEALIQELELSQQVRTPGFVTTAERNEIFRHARWMVTPPHTDEDLGLTPIEARHVGVPCIITRDGGLPEAGGQYALMCEPRDVDGLARCLEDAANMSEDEYADRAEQTRSELLNYLMPMSTYISEYDQLIREEKSPPQPASA